VNIDRPLSSLREKESSGLRRNGYVKRCLEVGTLDGSTVRFTPEQWQQVRNENWQVMNPYPYPMPGLGKMAGNAFKAVGRVVRNIFRGERIMRTAEDKNQIIEICKDCEFLRQSNGRCTKCGCTVISDILSKAQLATEACPIGRWK